ncbi:hypothetical protein HGB25_03655, partial [Candidatus Saccharibacteria bacterium]|nr:hypothetical protein [Candidatus Saccharibacteria bacterium]
MNRNQKQSGSVDAWMVTTIVMILFSVMLIGLSVWLFINYTDQKTNVDSKVSIAVADAKKSQADSDEAKFTKREKEPNREFVGPEDYGLLTFNYPKTWSVYVSKDASKGGTFEAYLNPVLIPPVQSNQQFAVRVVIE